MAYSPKPTTYARASASKRSAERITRFFVILGIAGIVTVTALSRGIDEVTPTTARVLFVVGAGLVTLSFIGQHLAMKLARYGITVGALRCALGRMVVLASVLAAAWGAGLDLQSLRLNALLGLLILVLIGQAASTAVQVVLFDGDCDRARFRLRGRQLRRTRVAWDAVSHVVFTAGSKAGTVELGLRTRSSPPTKPLPTLSGEVLIDLPYRVVVPQKNFELDAMRWLLNQTGRNDIALVERTAAGERGYGYANAWK